MNIYKITKQLLFLLGICFLYTCCAWGDFSDIYSSIGSQDSIHVTDMHNRIVLSKNSKKALIPASTIKILTSLAAFHYLGEDFRFKTEFYIDKNNNLKIKGYGDPLLISEVFLTISNKLSAELSIHTDKINNIILDSSYFAPLSIPGITSGSSEPYDASSGALCANFNTVDFYYDTEGNIKSAEEQTPLLPFAIKRIKLSGLSKGRIILSEHEGKLYPGYLFKYFLENNGITTLGNIKTGEVDLKSDTLIYTHISPFSLKELVAKLLEFSNNFIANQLFIATGAKALGVPGSLQKGVRSTTNYARSVLKLNDIVIVEGSGLSRQNRISSKSMDNLLGVFEKHRRLMRIKNNESYKTGTLTGISTRAGFFMLNKTDLYRYTIMFNTPGKSSEKLVEKIIKKLSKRKDAYKCNTGL